MIRGIFPRIAAAFGLAVIGYFVVTMSLSQALASRSATTALKFNADNAAALGRRALEMMQSGMTPANAAKAEALARRAIRRDPTIVDAVAVIGTVREMRKDIAGARQSFAYGEALSRRHLMVQLWLIEDSVRRDNVREALRHYDIALRTSRAAPGLLFPILVAGASDPTVRTELAAVLAKRPAWSHQFLQQLAQSGRDLPAIAALIEQLRQRGAPVAQPMLATTIARLIEAKQIEPAWRLYAAATPGASRAGLRDGGFAKVSDTPAPFEWTLTREGAATATVRFAQDGNRLAFSAEAGAGGVAARQVLLLAPGRHRLRGTVFDLAAQADTAPYFVLRCAGSTIEAGRVSLPAADAQGRPFAGSVQIPSGCGAQLLELVLQPSDSATPVSGELADLAIDQ